MSPNKGSYFGGSSTCAQKEIIFTLENGNLNKGDKHLWEGTEIQSIHSDFPQAVNWPKNTARNTSQCDNH